jgi:hypothetical protein
MRTIRSKILRLGLAHLLIYVVLNGVFAEGGELPIDVYIFWGDGCPHCAREMDFTQQWLDKELPVRFHYLEVTKETLSRRVFLDVVLHFSIERPTVPLTVVGERYFQGYDDDTMTGAEIKGAVERVCNLLAAMWCAHC